MVESTSLRTFTIRPATNSDGPGIASVHVQAWREAYTGRIPQSVIDYASINYREAQWTRALGSGGWLTGGHTTVRVAVDNGQVIGFSGAGPVGYGPQGAGEGDGESKSDSETMRTATTQPPPKPKQLYFIYVLASHYGLGAGTALLEAVLRPEEPVELWLLECNQRARAFYERNGFVLDQSPAGRKIDERMGGIVEVRMLRRPAGSTSANGAE